jgi:hypothetical protein
MSKIKVCTWYVESSPEEMPSLVDVDIVCLQGLDSKIFTPITQTIKHLGFTEVHSGPKSATGDTWAAMYSKIKYATKGYTGYPRSILSRGMTWAKVVLPDCGEIHIVTSELDSGGEGNTYRKLQSSDIVKTFTLGPVIFAGSTNIPEWQKLNIQDVDSSDQWSDAWMEKGVSTNEYTDGEDRLDRIWYTGMECVSYELRGHRMVVCGFK